MLVNISQLQDKLLAKYEDLDLALCEVPLVLQKTYETVAVLLYCAQRIEYEIRDYIMAPEFISLDVQYLLSDEVAGKKVLESLDELCNDAHIDKLVDVSVNVGFSKEDLTLEILPIYSDNVFLTDDTHSN